MKSKKMFLLIFSIKFSDLQDFGRLNMNTPNLISTLTSESEAPNTNEKAVVTQA